MSSRPGRTLLPGAQLNCAGTYRVTKADARRGKVVVRTAAHAERPYGESSRPSDDVVAKSAVPLKVVKISSTTAVPEASVGWPGSGLAEDPAQLPETGGPSALLGALSLAMLTAGAHRPAREPPPLGGLGRVRRRGDGRVLDQFEQVGVGANQLVRLRADAQG